VGLESGLRRKIRIVFGGRGGEHGFPRPTYLDLQDLPSKLGGKAKMLGKTEHSVFPREETVKKKNQGTGKNLRSRRPRIMASEKK